MRTGGEEMRKVDDYERIRKAYHIEGLSIREISRRYGHGRRLIRKALERPVPDRYQLTQSRRSNVLGQYRQRILDLLDESVFSKIKSIDKNN
jgi:transposase